ncbi:UNVERIFIED_CONTAM: hypothetical protein NCL1_34051 [Trichonephila clavipes]
MSNKTVEKISEKIQKCSALYIVICGQNSIWSAKAIESAIVVKLVFLNQSQVKITLKLESFFMASVDMKN